MLAAHAPMAGIHAAFTCAVEALRKATWWPKAHADRGHRDFVFTDGDRVLLSVGIPSSTP